MKKILFLCFLVMCVGISAQQKAARNYTITIPEKYGQAFWLLTHNQQKKLSVEDFEALIPELTKLLEAQLIAQSKQFQKEDSLALKADSLKNKK